MGSGLIEQNKINIFQLLFILIHVQIGIGVVTLPYDVFLKAQGDSWIAVLLAGFISQIMIFIFGGLMNRFPSNHLYEIVQILFGQWIGKIIILLYSLHFIILGGIFLAKFSVILKAWMMPITPKWIVITLILTLTVYVIKENLQVMARFFVITSFVFIIYLVLTAYALKDIDITYILPVGQSGIIPILQGIIPTLFALKGVEALLLIYPFVQVDTKQLVKIATIANIFVTFFYTFVTMITLLFLSPSEIKLIPEPVLYLVKSFSFKIIERPDLIFTSLWIILVASSAMVILYSASFGLSVMMNSNKREFYVYICAIMSFIVAMSIKGKYEVYFVTKLFNPFILLFMIGLPTFFYITSVVFNKKESEKSS